MTGFVSLLKLGTSSVSLYIVAIAQSNSKVLEINFGKSMTFSSITLRSQKVIYDTALFLRLTGLHRYSTVHLSTKL